MSKAEPKPFTGRKMLFVMIAFFGVIISVNMVLMFSAIGTFPGLEVKNSYVASQTFDRRAAEQNALGWTPSVTYEPGVLIFAIAGENGPVTPASIVAKVGRPTYSGEDQQVEFVLGPVDHRAVLTLAPGPWRVFIDAVAEDGTVFETRLNLLVPKD
ncbi:MAG: FixH family protein [Rhodobacteraceae bacterium]|nr:FixH family protein [Paracoccaceae bacterium]